MKKSIWIVFVVLCLLIGLYPLLYFVIDRQFGLLQTKDPQLLQNILWNVMFYTHIVLGGLALLVGWIPLHKKYREANMQRHRTIGKVYMIAVLFSSLSGIYVSLYATGGWIAQLGFLLLGIVWFSTTLLGYLTIKKGNVAGHQKMMIYSFAACFAAVTLRLWLPTLSATLGDFVTAYRMTAWLCWVPNMAVAYFIVRRTVK